MSLHYRPKSGESTKDRIRLLRYARARLCSYLKPSDECYAALLYANRTREKDERLLPSTTA